MKLAKTDKTLILCIIFISGISSFLLKAPIIYLCLVFILSFYLLYKKAISYKFTVACIFLSILSLFYISWNVPAPDKLSYLSSSKKNMKITGRVISIPKNIKSYKKKFEFEVLNVKSDSGYQVLNSRSIVNLYKTRRLNKEKIVAGDILELEGKIKQPFKATNPGQFNYRQYLRNKGIFTVISTSKIISLEHPKPLTRWYFIQKLNNLRDKIVKTYSKYLKTPNLEIIGGIVFGDHAVPAPDYVKQIFIRSGLLHLLAASGMNVGIIYGIWYFLCSRAFIPYKVTVLSGIIVVILYSLLTGLPPSVYRAALMLIFILIGKLIDRDSDNLLLLAISGVLMIFCNPMLVTNISFQLSFLVTLGLIICVPVLIDKFKPIPVYLSGVVIIPLIAQIWASPIQLYYFKTFTTYSVFSNAVVTPFIAIISFLGFIGGIFAIVPGIGDIACSFVSFVCNPIVDLILCFSDFVSSLPCSVQTMARPRIIEIITFYLLVFLAINFIKSKITIKKIILITGLAALFIFYIFVQNTNLENHEFVFFDNNAGDIVYIKTPGNKKILINTGHKKTKYFPSRNIVIPFLKERGIKELNYIILSNPSSNLIGGAEELISKLRVNKVFHNGQVGKSNTYKSLKTYLSATQTPYIKLNNSDNIISSKNFFIKSIIPEDSIKKTYNDNSVILFLKYKKFKALLMSSYTKDSFEEIKKHIKPPINMLKINNDKFLSQYNLKLIKYLQPEIVIIYQIKNNINQYNNLLKNKMIFSLSDSAVNITTDGEKLKAFRYLDN